MKNEISKINEGALSAILDVNKSGLGAFSAPYSREILLFTSIGVAGTRSIFNMDEIFPSLHPGSKVTFLREPDNLNDKWAVKVLDSKQRHFGYLSFDCEEVVARLMDAGKALFGKILNTEIRGDWHLIELEVYLDD